MKPADLRGLYEEISNSVTHAIGLGLAAAALAALLIRAGETGDVWRVAAAAVFGACMLRMYLSSTLYHGYQLQPVKHYLRVFDHITIYFVICGTISPFPLIYDRSTWGWCVLGILWFLFVLKSWFGDAIGE